MRRRASTTRPRPTTPRPSGSKRVQPRNGTAGPGLFRRNRVHHVARLPQSLQPGVPQGASRYPRAGKETPRDSANRQAEDEKFARDLTKRLEKLPQDKRKAEIQRLGGAEDRGLTIAGRKQIEKILTGQQLDAYKQHALAERVYQLMTMSPDAFNSVGVTPEQLAKLRRLAAEINRQSGERSRQQHEALVAVLERGPTREASRRGGAGVSPAR